MQVNKYKYRNFLVVFLLGGIFLSGIFAYRMLTKSSTFFGNTDPFPSPIGTGEKITFSGQMVCLPHKNPSGPQTMECAYGLKTPEGIYYVLKDTNANYKHLMGIPVGKHVTVQGNYLPQADMIYPTEGIIAIESIEEN